MRARLILAVTGVVIAAIFAATAGGGISGARGGATSGAEANTLNWALSVPQSLDPVLSTAQEDVGKMQLVYDTLVRLDANSNPTPALATSWKFLGNGFILEFKLRTGVKFSDGAPFNADAVKANMDRAKNQPGSLLAPLLTAVTNTKVVNASTFRFYFSKRAYDIVQNLGGKLGMMVSPLALANPAALPTKPVGSGPFILDNFVPGGSATLHKNHEYWNGKNIHIERLNLTFTANPQTFNAGLQSGQFDMATLPDPKLVEVLKGAGLMVDIFAGGQIPTLLVNTKMAPFTDFRVVQAMNFAVDRRALVRTQNGGWGTPTIQPFPVGHIGYSPAAAKAYSYDPAKAKSLLAAAGYGNGSGPTVTLIYTAFGTAFQAISEQVQAQLKAVGFNISVEGQSVPATAAHRVNHDVPLMLLAFSGRESAVERVRTSYGAAGLQNLCRCATREFNQALLAAQRYPVNDARYSAAMKKLTEIAVTKGGNISLYSTPQTIAHSKRVTGIPHSLYAQPRLEGVRVSS